MNILQGPNINFLEGNKEGDEGESSDRRVGLG